MLKSRSLVVFLVQLFFGLPEIIIMCDVISGCACFVCVGHWYDKKLFYPFMF